MHIVQNDLGVCASGGEKRPAAKRQKVEEVAEHTEDKVIVTIIDQAGHMKKFSHVAGSQLSVLHSAYAKHMGMPPDSLNFTCGGMELDITKPLQYYLDLGIDVEHFYASLRQAGC